MGCSDSRLDGSEASLQGPGKGKAPATDPSSGATVQEGYRGPPPQAANGQKSGGGEEEVDIDLEDPAVQDAAVKIQAQFKGFKTRQDLQGHKVDAAPGDGEAGENEEGELDKSPSSEAAQAPDEVQQDDANNSASGMGTAALQPQGAAPQTPARD